MNKNNTNKKLRFYDTVVDYGIAHDVDAAGVQGFNIIQSRFEVEALTYAITYEIDGLGVFNISIPAAHVGFDDVIIAMIIAGYEASMQKGGGV